MLFLCPKSEREGGQMYSVSQAFVDAIESNTRIKENESLAIGKKLRVAAYCRVSIDSDEQMVSLEAQENHYESYIRCNLEWEFAFLVSGGKGSPCCTFHCGTERRYAYAFGNNQGIGAVRHGKRRLERFLYGNEDL